MSCIYVYFYAAHQRERYPEFAVKASCPSSLDSESIVISSGVDDMICRKIIKETMLLPMYNNKEASGCCCCFFLYDVLGGHEKRVDVLEAVELALVDLSDEAPEMATQREH